MWNWMMLGLESNRVIGLRIAKLMRGGKAAQREAQRMVSEKMLAAAKAGTSLMAGASGDKIVEQYRRKVAANAKRLSRKRTRRRPKGRGPLGSRAHFLRCLIATAGRLPQ